MSKTGPPILIVDDLSDDRFLLERIIRACKILNPVCLIETGGDCIRFFERDASTDQPEGCILFLDLMMQPTSGLEVMEKVRGLSSAKKSLIVMMSGLSDIKAIHQGYQLGANTFLIKPLKPEDVLQLIQNMGQRVMVEEKGDGYLIHLVPDSDTSFVQKTGCEPLFSIWADRLKRGQETGENSESPGFPEAHSE